MSLFKVEDKLQKAIYSKKYDAIMCNFANPDMLGHTGNIEATIEAIEDIDKTLGNIINALKKVNGEVIIIADHGNAEKMINLETGQPHTAHTTAQVPFIYMGRKAKIVNNSTAHSLVDVAPTMLYLLGIDKPEEMTGNSLVKLY